MQHLWRLHVRAFLSCLVVAVISAMASYIATPMLPILRAALVCVGLVPIGQHVVIGIVIWRGLHAARRPDPDSYWEQLEKRRARRSSM